MTHPALLVELRDRGSAQILAASGAHLFNQNIWISFRNDRGHHFAALIDFRHQAIGLMAPCAGDRRARPFCGPCCAKRAIFQHINKSVFAAPRCYNSAIVSAA